MGVWIIVAFLVLVIVGVVIALVKAAKPPSLDAISSMLEEASSTEPPDKPGVSNARQ